METLGTGGSAETHFHVYKTPCGLDVHSHTLVCCHILYTDIAPSFMYYVHLILFCSVLLYDETLEYDLVLHHTCLYSGAAVILETLPEFRAWKFLWLEAIVPCSEPRAETMTV